MSHKFGLQFLKRVTCKRKSSVTALIQDLGWTDLQARRKIFRLTSLYTILNGLIAVPVSDLLTPADERTRGGHKK